MQPIEQVKDPEVAALAASARDYLGSQRWVAQITSGRVAFAEPGVLGVFQFDLEATEPNIPTPLWVVAGDVPPAYLPCDDLPTWQAALDGYVWEMQRWVDAVRADGNIEDLIPVAASPTREHADMLASRLALIRQHILVDGRGAGGSDA